jgi:hypothetical protein
MKNRHFDPPLSVGEYEHWVLTDHLPGYMEMALFHSETVGEFSQKQMIKSPLVQKYFLLIFPCISL